MGEDHAGRGAGRGQLDLTGEALRGRVGIVGLTRARPQLAQLERAGRGELVGAREDLDGAASADTLAAAGLGEREAEVAGRVEQGGPGIVGEGGRIEGLLAASRAEHDLGHGLMVRPGRRKTEGPAS